MKPKIGVSGKISPGPGWSKRLGESEFNTIEIHSIHNRFSFNQRAINAIKENIGHKDLSFHTATMMIFHKEDKFTQAELAHLKAEIKFAELLNIKEIVFHLNTKPLREQQVKDFQKIINYAQEKNIELLYEGNSHMDEQTIYSILMRFPKLNFNLDLGHFNISASKGLIKDPEEFIKRLKDRIVYVHAHNNDGKKDTHLAIDQGTLDYENILSKLNLKILKKIIIEVKDIEHARTSYKLLNDFYKNKTKD
jgi:sugar phosphate isomerase/epimerase